ncbi:ABC transporter permease subunit [Acutalibacter caecimuris]|uniref:ABC transporter permease subunit n=1 Tax=Acutalibacter caecimuris TaxID=3093657 RepID=UPI002AC8DB2B|nr:ABC transporter permease subunit [Acutalibacter sp. M00118]
MDKRIIAIIKKDIRGMVSNKRMLTTLLVVPLVLTVFVPSMFILTLWFFPGEGAELLKMLKMLPLSITGEGEFPVLAGLLLNYLMPVFFLLIPIMAASVMAATSFVGEKEKHTLETLLYSPLSLRQIFRAKVAAAFLLSMLASAVSFVAMLAVIEMETSLLAHRLVVPSLKWLAVLLLVAPAISLIAITLMVRVSAKAQSVEEAQQGAIFLLLPVLMLLIGQFTGLLLVSGWLLVAIGIVCAVLAVLLLRQAQRGFTYEKLLQ